MKKGYFLGIRFDSFLPITIVWFIVATVLPLFVGTEHIFWTILRNFAFAFGSWVFGFIVGFNQDETYDQRWKRTITDVFFKK